MMLICQVVGTKLHVGRSRQNLHSQIYGVEYKFPGLYTWQYLMSHYVNFKMDWSYVVDKPEQFLRLIIGKHVGGLAIKLTY